MDTKETRLVEIQKQLLNRQKELIAILSKDIEKRDEIIKEQMTIIKESALNNLQKDQLIGDLKTYITQLNLAHEFLKKVGRPSYDRF